MTKNFTAYSYRTDPAVPAFADDKPVILFDAVCVLCSYWVRFVMEHDPHARYRLLPAQSPLGQAMLRHYGLDTVDFESAILIEDGKAWFKSDTPLRVIGALGFPWRLAVALRVMPLPLRDWLYDIVARNRYRWPGRRASCMRPHAALNDRFLDQSPL